MSGKVTETWTRVIEKQPDQIIVDPKSSSERVLGEDEEYKVTFSIELGRLDWSIFHAADENILTLDLRANLDSSIKKLQTVVSKWLQVDFPGVYRVAFGATLLCETQGKVQSYDALSKLVPVKIDSKESSDFSYKINRPRPSKNIEGLKINRLSQWSSGRFDVKAFTGDAEHELELTASTKFVVRLELDINNVPDFNRTLSTEQISTLFEEEIELGVEIAANGDIK